ncbi:hypothetical protein GNP81_15050 [Aliivibrio fischeri]|uniref:hypothetical protein n=1 Tax=Aliivibrio fischeri TaxID=668 RepID=UPI0012D957B0|nr:hypothetical protein [Aliivibrio fischeri]MUK61855.1 hypothetical protein [Aliivibrio fischeri]MUK69291.1 hypothetical protein [Aliivibrio fischeri]MUK75144.1 hypothetical protein [Aliivibrio fischeri]MUK75396.1 hypothetical protein [Aliivibrio fischeri]MUL21874.1 hypothetical protein [Aliivibrio fischeri]
MKNIILDKIAIASITALFLMACSDSGGSSSGGSAGGSSPAADEKPEPIKTQDLVAPEGFSFNPIDDQRLIVDLSGSLPSRAHLSVYSSFSEKDDGGYIVDYGSKIIDVPLTNGAVDIEFSIADSLNESVVEIWLYDGSDPQQKKFVVDGTQWEWY